MAFRSAVITFPGSNCDRDMAVALEQVSGTAPHRVWHGDSDLPDGLDFIAVPGGFSYGDYLRSGAMAEQASKPTPVCAACSKQMTFVDAIGSPEGPIVIFRCPDCKKLFWEKPRRDEK